MRSLVLITIVPGFSLVEYVTVDLNDVPLPPNIPKNFPIGLPPEKRSSGSLGFAGAAIAVVAIATVMAMPKADANRRESMMALVMIVGVSPWTLRNRLQPTGR